MQLHVFTEYRKDDDNIIQCVFSSAEKARDSLQRVMDDGADYQAPFDKVYIEAISGGYENDDFIVLIEELTLDQGPESDGPSWAV